MVFRFFAAGCALLPCLALAAGPTGKLYMTVTNADLLVTVQGSDATFATTVFGDEGPIAVYGGIKTTSIGSGGYGASYTLDGDFSGDLYRNEVPSSSHDATTDGLRNYVLNDAGTVYATGAAFELPVALFQVGANARGIAYDPYRDTLWVDTDGFLTQYSTTGEVESAFALAQGDGAVAFDQTDGTLWVGSVFAGDTLLTQYTAAGTQIQSYLLGTGLTVSGMEFDAAPVPEPASLLVLGLGALAARRRRRNAR